MEFLLNKQTMVLYLSQGIYENAFEHFGKIVFIFISIGVGVILLSREHHVNYLQTIPHYHFLVFVFIIIVI